MLYVSGTPNLSIALVALIFLYLFCKVMSDQLRKRIGCYCSLFFLDIFMYMGMCGGDAVYRSIECTTCIIWKPIDR